MIKAEDILHAWTRKTRAVLNPSVQESLQQQVKPFAELTFPTEQPKELSRCEREREQHTNKKEALGGGTCKSRGRVPTHGCQQASGPKEGAAPVPEPAGEPKSSSETAAVTLTPAAKMPAKKGMPKGGGSSRGRLV